MKGSNVAGSLGSRRSPKRDRSPGSKFLPPLGGPKSKDYPGASSQDAARIRAGYQSIVQDRRGLAVEILKEGRAQAFLDFFELSGGSDSSSSSSGRSAESSSLSPDSLVLLQQQLRRADAALSAGDKEQAFDAYRHMGLFFKQMGHRDNAKTFFQKCLQVGRRYAVAFSSEAAGHTHIAARSWGRILAMQVQAFQPNPMVLCLPQS